MFKWKPVLLIALVSTNLLAKEASENSEIETEVLAAFSNLVTASKELDKKRYFQLIHFDKFVGLNNDGTNWNSVEDLKPLITGAFAAVNKVKKLEFPNVKVSVINASTAVLVNEFIQISELSNGDIVKFCGGGSQVWSKEKGVWKIVSISASDNLSNCTP